MQAGNTPTTSDVGTYHFGLHGCWGRRGVHRSTVYDDTFSQYPQVGKYSPTCHPLVSITPFRHRNMVTYMLYYVIDVHVSDATQTRRAIISHRDCIRLYVRYTRSTSPNHTMQACVFSFHDPSATGGRVNQNTATAKMDYLTCQPCFQFLNNLQKGVERKFNNKLLSEAYTVFPDLYTLWSCTNFVNTELFASSLNESGVLQYYCSNDASDTIFSALGNWESFEGSIEGGCGNPPFDQDMIERILVPFENGVRKDTPYCRCMLLPLAKKYGVLQHLGRLSSEGIHLVTIKEGALPLRSDYHMISFATYKPKGYGYQSVGLFVWRNRAYLLKNPTPVDVEAAYMRWIHKAVTNPQKAELHREAFRKAFPMEMRCAESVSNILCV